jgi:hypothetical protein
MQGEDDDRPNTNQVKVVFIPVVKYKHDRSMQAKLSQPAPSVFGLHRLGWQTIKQKDQDMHKADDTPGTSLRKA